MTVELLRRMFSTTDYESMSRAGILTEDDRVELIEGEILEMAAIGSRHAACVKRLNQLLSRSLGGRAILGVQDPIRLDDSSEPEPDLSLLEPRDDFYAESHPGPKDVLLLIEVSEASVEFDREVKLPLYARSGISELCLVDLTRGVVNVLHRPSPAGYGESRELRRGQTLTFAALPGVEISVDSVLGP